MLLCLLVQEMFIRQRPPDVRSMFIGPYGSLQRDPQQLASLAQVLDRVFPERHHGTGAFLRCQFRNGQEEPDRLQGSQPPTCMFLAHAQGEPRDAPRLYPDGVVFADTVEREVT